MNLQDKLNGLDAWESGIDSSDQPHATDEWKERAKGTVARNRAIVLGLIEEFGDVDLPDITQAAFGVSPMSQVESAAVRWQWGHHIGLSDTERAQWELLGRADAGELDRLAEAYPVEVTAIRRWRHESGFSERIDALLAR